MTSPTQVLELEVQHLMVSAMSWSLTTAQGNVFFFFFLRYMCQNVVFIYLMRHYTYTVYFGTSDHTVSRKRTPLSIIQSRDGEHWAETLVVESDPKRLFNS